MKARRVHGLWWVLGGTVAAWLILGAAVAMVLLILRAAEAAVRVVLAVLGWV